MICVITQRGPDPGCGGLSTVMFPRYRTFDYQNATGCFVGLCVGGLVVGDHFFVLRAEKCQGCGFGVRGGEGEHRQGCPLDGKDGGFEGLYR